MSKLIYGRNPVLSSLGENRVEKVFLDVRFNDAKFLAKLVTKKVLIEKVNSSKLDELSNRGVHQVVVA